MAVGTTLGFLINPEAAEKAGIDIQSIKRTMPLIGSSPAEPVKQADWPTNEHAKRELFRFAMWDIETFGPKSEILITRCISRLAFIGMRNAREAELDLRRKNGRRRFSIQRPQLEPDRCESREQECSHWILR